MVQPLNPSPTQNLVYSDKFQDRKNSLQLSITLVSFQDTKGIFILYAPQFDLSGYGKNQEEARASFQIALDDLVSYTLSKGTFESVLQELGWKRVVSKTKKWRAPQMNELIKKRAYLSEIFNNYTVTTFQEKIGIPQYA